MSRRPQERMSEIALLLYQIVKDKPGIHFRSLGRAARLSSVGQLRHHLDQLRRQGAIVEVKDGRFKRFFVSGDHEPQVRQGLARFARPVPRRIGMLLLNRPMNRTELRRSLDCADSTLGYHLNRMVALGDLVRTRGRNCTMYSLSEPDFVRGLLRQQPGVPAELQAAVAEESQLAATPAPVPAAATNMPESAHPGALSPGRGISLRQPAAADLSADAPSPGRGISVAGEAQDPARTEGPAVDGDDDPEHPRPQSRGEGRARKSSEILAWHGQG